MIRRAWEAVAEASMVLVLFLMLILGWICSVELED